MAKDLLRLKNTFRKADGRSSVTADSVMEKTVPGEAKIHQTF
jgi:hypothetical protein